MCTRRSTPAEETQGESSLIKTKRRDISDIVVDVHSEIPFEQFCAVKSSILVKSETFLGIRFLSARKTMSIAEKTSYVEIYQNRESRGSPEPHWDVDRPRRPWAEGPTDREVNAAAKSLTSSSKRFLCHRGHRRCTFHLSAGWSFCGATVTRTL